MRLELPDPVRIASLSADAGVGIWVILFVVDFFGGGEMGVAARVLLFAILVLVPLALSLVSPTESSGWFAFLYRAAVVLQPIGAVAATTSFFLPAGLSAALLCLPWLGFAGTTALLGLARSISRRLSPLEELCVDVGLMYLALGGGWLVVSRYGATPMGFGDLIVLLTAMHFHYAGFLAPLLVGLTGRALRGSRAGAPRVFRLASIGILGGPMLVAAGITLSPALEVVAVFLLAVSLACFALLQLFVVVPTVRNRTARALLVVSALSMATAMGFAAAYGVGEFSGVTVVTISRMAQVHGWLNAVGFGLCGLLGWRLELSRGGARG